MKASCTRFSNRGCVEDGRIAVLGRLNRKMFDLDFEVMLRFIGITKGIRMNTAADLKSALVRIEEQLSSLSAEKIRIEAELDVLERQQAKEALNKIVDELKALNLDPNEIAKALGVSVVGSQQKKTRAARGSAGPKATGTPKYRSSLDPSLTWTGKGRKPGWIQTFIDNGGNLEDWLIKN